MDFSQYENYGFDRFSAINLSTGYKERSYQAHWHPYGEIVLVGPGKTNVFMVNQRTYELVEGDFLLIWPMEMHGIIDADREKSLIIQFSNAFMNSLFDLQRIMHFYRNLHVLCINAHPQLVAGLTDIVNRMREIYLAAAPDRELRCCILLMEFMLTLDEHRDEFMPEIHSGDPYNCNDTVIGGRSFPGRHGTDGRHQQGLFLPDLPQRHGDELQQVAEHDPDGAGVRAPDPPGHDPDGDCHECRLPEHLQLQPGVPGREGHVPGGVPGPAGPTLAIPRKTGTHLW